MAAGFEVGDELFGLLACEAGLDEERIAIVALTVDRPVGLVVGRVGGGWALV